MNFAGRAVKKFYSAAPNAVSLNQEHFQAKGLGMAFDLRPKRVIVFAVFCAAFLAFVPASPVSAQYFIKKKESAESAPAESSAVKKDSGANLNHQQAGGQSSSKNRSPAAPSSCSKEDEKFVVDVAEKLKLMKNTKKNDDKNVKSAVAFFSKKENISLMTGVFSRCPEAAQKYIASIK